MKMAKKNIKEQAIRNLKDKLPHNLKITSIERAYGRLVINESMLLFARDLKKRKLCVKGVCYVLTDNIDLILKQEGIK